MTSTVADERALDLVLRQIHALRDAYKARNIGQCKEAFRRVSVLLQDPTISDFLDAELKNVATDQLAIPTNPSDTLLAIEIRYAERFGYGPAAADDHITRARKLVTRNPHNLITLRSTEQLLAQLVLFHANVITALESHGLRFERLRSARKRRNALKIAETALYAAGSVVADGLHIPAFSVSYAVAVGLLSDVASNAVVDPL